MGPVRNEHPRLQAWGLTGLPPDCHAHPPLSTHLPLGCAGPARPPGMYNLTGSEVVLATEYRLAGGLQQPMRDEIGRVSVTTTGALRQPAGPSSLGVRRHVQGRRAG